MIGAPARGWAALACLAAPLVAGCLGPRSVTCSDGRVCPAGTGCDVVNHRCVSAAEFEACNGLSEGADCSLAGAPGACHSDLCQPFYCGDRFVTGLEMCDGEPPQNMSCASLGFDRGLMGCSDACLPATEGCGYFGWPVAVSDVDSWFTGLWGSGPRDVFAVGYHFTDAAIVSLVLHWDGSAWSPMSTGALDVTLEDVWGAGPDDVYAVGGSGAILHWDGRAWSKVTAPTSANLKSVWGSGPDDVYAVGVNGTSLHWDGVAWRPLPFGTNAALFGVWGTAHDDVFVVGGLGAIWHWDGVEWTPMPIDAPTDTTLTGVWGFGPNDVYVVGARSNGGVVLHWNGVAWAELPAPPTTTWLNAVWGTAPDNLFVTATASSSGLFHWDGSVWTEVRTQAPASVNAIWGSGPDDIFAASGWAIVHGPGTVKSVITAQAVGVELRDVRGIDGFEDVVAVGTTASGQGAIAHWNGSAWSVEIPAAPPLRPLARVWAASPTDLFALTDLNAHDGTFDPGGTVWRGSGTSWVATVVAPAALLAIWGTGADNVFATSISGTIFRWDGTRWQTSFSDPLVTAPLRGLWGSGPRDVLAVGERGTILRWDGTAWTKMRVSGTNASSDSSGSAAGGPGGPPGSTPNVGEESLSDVWGTGPADVYAAGEGAMLHWDGTFWRRVPWNGTTGGSFNAVAGSGPGDRFACEGMTLFHAYGGTWESINLPRFHPLGPDGAVGCGRLHVTPRRLFIVGPGGTLVLDRPEVTCAGREAYCSDGWDNDCDGLADAADPDCPAPAERCANLSDDDRDGKIDCADPDCATFPSCKGR